MSGMGSQTIDKIEQAPLFKPEEQKGLTMAALNQLARFGFVESTGEGTYKITKEVYKELLFMESME